ncbi:SusF/SusE family outer membrane protein [Tamlana sp. 2_MG-2023]|uniref:SusF/SusE family outer membrane protein n=1 Tax=unclassified Tamlana TaxID=2614803 RepID=UPI0026E31E45|nr:MULTISPECIES: SusF/SusE family outer membrane protein [unclassified Tamlana]MDO6761360.1 SusF/SusE family outer membrane protein [Tamlana sp. 2_MG-2023]MDO6792026.1 SusF/SusE family outer membrane protein [Tamlana sp. 1_MG-2023]
MKNIKLITLFIVSMLALSACTEDDHLTYIAQPEGDLEFTNSFLPEYLLSPAASSNIGERFTWKSADFGTPTNISYEIQRSILGDFTDTEVVGTTSENNYVVTIGELITIAEEAGLDSDPSTDDMPNTGNVAFRVRAFAGTDSDTELISTGESLALVMLEDTGAPALPTFRNLFLVGDATAPGWNPDNNNPAITRDPADENIYSYIGYFNGGSSIEGFKLLEVADWSPQWGGSAGTLGVNDGTGSDPAAFAVPTPGYYSFSMNITDMTYTLEAYDDSGDSIYPTIGIIGDSTEGGWDNDMDMTQSDFDPHIWNIQNVTLADGELKFRANDAWDDSWGADTAFSGFATAGGPNIPVMAGTYNIWFNDLDGGYVLIPVQ